MCGGHEGVPRRGQTNGAQRFAEEDWQTSLKLYEKQINSKNRKSIEKRRNFGNKLNQKYFNCINK